MFNFLDNFSISKGFIWYFCSKIYLHKYENYIRQKDIFCKFYSKS